MDIEIINKDFQLNIYGFGGIAANKDYSATAFKLSGRMWEVIKANNVKNKGKNIWVYEPNNEVFAGVELEDAFDRTNLQLEEKKLDLKKHAYFKHIGPYSFIKQTGQNMTNQLTKQGYEVILPYVEIYGHWSRDDSKLETELLMCLK